MSSLLVHGGTLITLANPNRILTNHAVWIEDGVIKSILPQRSAARIKARSIDAHGMVVMPGLINAHTHCYSSFARGLTKAAPASNFLEILRNLWWRLDRRLTLDDCYVSALVAGMDAIRHGTTTILDHHASQSAVKGSLDRVAKAVKELGLRAVLCYEVSDRNGTEIAQEGMAENLRFLEKCRQYPDNQLKALFGLHASFTLGERTLRRCVESAEEYRAGFHIHCAEDIADQQITQRRFGRRVVQRLADLGILGPRTICAHGVHLRDSEWELLAQTQTAVVHNPQSNMNNAVGLMDLAKAGQKGVLVGLGTDAMTNNMFEELRSAIWAQKLLRQDPRAGFSDAVNLLIRNNQAIANRYFHRVGRLQEGWMGDLIFLDYSPPTEMNEENFPGHLVFGLSQAAVDTTIVGGKILMRNRLFPALDEQAITRRARRLSSALRARFQATV
jgi:putative selenium metabolism protein SsnA